MRKYAIREVFATVQGEGMQAGTPAVFVRFAGCNLWTGQDKTRLADAQRHDAACPVWCDTDFRKGDSMDGLDLVEAIYDACDKAQMRRLPLLVLTGGEPMLQLDVELVQTLREALIKPPITTIAIETNGSVEIPREIDRLLGWICVSPKQRPEAIKQRHGNELKVPFPDSLVEPEAYRNALTLFDHYVITPRAVPISVGRSIVDRDDAQRAARYAMRHDWRFSLQAHKHLGMP